MKCDWKKLATEVVSSLSPAEREASIVYLEQRVISPEEDLSWAEITRNIDKPVVIAFVDLEPALNWTHRARYVVLDTQGTVQQTIDVDRPPFLTGASPDLCVIHRGDRAPEWAQATTKQPGNINYTVE